MTDRGVSTVVDVAVALLLVSAGTVVLATTRPPPPRQTDADAVSTTVATATTTVEYSVSGSGRTRNRTVTGPLAALLADAAIVAARSDGGGRQGYVAAVRRASNRTARRIQPRTQIVAVWQPYPDAPVDGRVLAGRTPPPTADVDAIALRIPVANGESNARRREPRPAGDGVDRVARETAVLAVAALYPRSGAHPFDGPQAVRSPTASAYADDSDWTPASVRLANRRETARLARAFRADLADRYETEAAAARTVTADQVTIVVRTWSR